MKRKISVVLIVCMMALIFTGCGSKTDDNVLKLAYEKMEKTEPFHPLAHPFANFDCGQKTSGKVKKNLVIDTARKDKLLALFQMVSGFNDSCVLYDENLDEEYTSYEKFEKEIRLPETISTESDAADCCLDAEMLLTEEEKDSFFEQLEKLGYGDMKPSFQIVPIPENGYDEEDDDYYKDYYGDVTYEGHIKNGIEFMFASNGSVEINCDYMTLYRFEEMASYIDNNLADGFVPGLVYEGNGYQRLAFSKNDYAYADEDESTQIYVYFREGKVLQVELILRKTVDRKRAEKIFEEEEYETLINCITSISGDRQATEKFVKEFSTKSKSEGKIGSCSWKVEESNISYNQLESVIRFQ